jgi:hypothetical protein
VGTEVSLDALEVTVILASSGIGIPVLRTRILYLGTAANISSTFVRVQTLNCFGLLSGQFGAE